MCPRRLDLLQKMKLGIQEKSILGVRSRFCKEKASSWNVLKYKNHELSWSKVKKVNFLPIADVCIIVKGEVDITSFLENRCKKQWIRSDPESWAFSKFISSTELCNDQLFGWAPLQAMHFSSFLPMKLLKWKSKVLERNIDTLKKKVKKFVNFSSFGGSFFKSFLFKGQIPWKNQKRERQKRERRLYSMKKKPNFHEILKQRCIL